ncbi:MAG: hypothetical protein V6Z78_05130 [Holosporaceae bacterium]
MKLNKIWFFPCLCLLFLGMVGSVHAWEWPWSTKDNEEKKLLLTSTYGDTRKGSYSLPSDQPTKWRKMWQKIEKKAPYYGMRATLPLYDVLTNRAIWTGAGGLLGAMLGGGYGWTSLAGGIAGAVVGYNVAGVLENQISASWMNTFAQAARKAGRDKDTTSDIVGKTFNHYLMSKAAQETADEVLNNCWKNA